MKLNSEQIKKLSIQVMVGSLVGAAVIAVVAVLAGSFNDTFGKALLTLAFVAIHALLALAFVGKTQNSTGSKLTIFINSVFLVIVLSFFTSIFGAWELLDGELVAKLYATYFVIVFASLHGEMLAKMLDTTKLIRNIVYANFAFMAVVVVLLMPVIWMGDDLNDFYFRLLAASAIIDATLTILAVIMHKLYLEKHPEIKSQLYQTVTKLDENGKPIEVKQEVSKRRIHPLLWVLIVFIGLQIVLSVAFSIADF